jgi:hypothetical protein
MKETWYRKDDYTSRGLVDMWQIVGYGARLMVEIGTADGGSVRVFKSLAPDMQIVAVDPWEPDSNYGEDVFQSFLRNIAEYDDVSYLRDYSLNAATMFPLASVDIIYLDAVHTYEAVSLDMIAWLPVLKPGGWFCGHDYAPEFEGVIQAVNEHATGTVYTFQDTSFAFQLPKAF